MILDGILQIWIQIEEGSSTYIILKRTEGVHSTILLAVLPAKSDSHIMFCLQSYGDL